MTCSRLDGATAAMYVGARRMAVIVHEGDPLKKGVTYAAHEGAGTQAQEGPEVLAQVQA